MRDNSTIDLGRLSVASFSEQVVTLRHLFGLKQAELAQMLGVSEKTISRWERGENVSDVHLQNKRSIDALRTIAETLGDVFEPDTIKVWVDRTNPALGGERPRDFAKKDGGIFIMAQLLGTVGR